MQQSFPKDRPHLAAVEVADVEVERGVVARRVPLKPVRVRLRRFHLMVELRLRQLQRVSAEVELEVEVLRLRHSLRPTYRNTAAW